jgi:hypothetical protein
MAWAVPPVWATGDVITAARLNLDRDNFVDLDRRASFIGGSVEAEERTTSTAYVDLATAGPSVSVDIGQTGQALVHLYAALSNSTAGNATHMSYAISGATTRGAADNFSIAYTPGGNFRGARLSGTSHVFGLAPGVNTFTAKYRCSGGEGIWTNRRIMVVPFGS